MNFNARHPIWKLLRLAIILFALTAVLWINANKFDVTELRTIITMFVVLAGGDVATSLIQRRNDG